VCGYKYFALKVQSNDPKRFNIQYFINIAQNQQENKCVPELAACF